MKALLLLFFVFFTLLLDANTNQVILNSTENHIFKKTSSIELKVYVFKPNNWETSINNPAIVFYFGGGWNSRHITQFVAYAEYYSSKGYVCFIPDYRVRSLENSQAIDSVRDAQDAFAYIRKNSEKFKIDPNRIIASGGSAGGHLAASLGTLKDLNNGDLSKPNALILFNPVSIVDPITNPKRFNYARLGVKGHEISPYHHIDNTVPPTIIYHGTEDRLVSFETAKMFHKKMVIMGNDSTLIPFRGRDHGFFNHGKHLPKSDYQETLNYTNKFLNRIGFLIESD